MHKKGYVYMMSSPSKSTLYVGVTSNLIERVQQHKDKVYPKSFTTKYNCVMLVYYCAYENIMDAIV
jgi:putative endonuclease